MIDWVSLLHRCGGWKMKIWKWYKGDLWNGVSPPIHRIMTGSKHLNPEPWLHSQLWWTKGVASLSSHLCSVGPQAVALAPVVTSSCTAPCHWLLGDHRSPGGRGSKTAKAPPVGEVLVPGGGDEERDVLWAKVKGYLQVISFKKKKKKLTGYQGWRWRSDLPGLWDIWTWGSSRGGPPGSLSAR